MNSFAANRETILRMLRREGPASKPALARRLNTSLPTIGKLIGVLEREGIVADAGQAGSTGGRPPVLVGLNGRHMQLIGATVSNRSLAVRGYDLCGEAVGEVSHVQLPAGGSDELLVEVESALRPFAENAGERLGGIGIGLSGLVDSKDGSCRYLSGRTENGPFAFGELLSGRFGVPVCVVNDVFASTLAEQRFGAGREHEDFLYLHAGRGVGLGVVTNGRVHTGSRGHGGELGHTLADPNGPVCYCGNYGCLESVASPPAIVRQALEAIEKGVQSSIPPANDDGEVTIDTIFAAADLHDRLACNLLEQAGAHLGIAAANAANVLEPAKLVLGGRLTDASDVLIETIRRVFLSRRLPLLGDEFHVVVSDLGSYAACRGAVEVVFEKVVLTG